jgi:hypothetical protein
VFISYTRVDRPWVDRLQQMMVPMLRNSDQELRLWDDSQIEPGQKWREAIETALNEAKVALLLVSDAFLASEFVMHEEVPALLAAAKAEGVRILWVSLSPCLVEQTPIHAYQAVLPPERCLAEMGEVEQQRALIRIAEVVFYALEEDAEHQRRLAQQQRAMELERQQDQQQAIRWRSRWRRWREPLAEGVELLMAWIPADPAGQQREYLLASEPISLRQWQVVAGWPAEGEDLNPDPSEHHLPDQPVTGISHQQALEFCRRLATHSGRYYELPSHEQWEHACRAGSPSAYSWGDAWSESLAADTANPWGLRQMQGGLWEWCHEGGLRGGSWNDPVERRQCDSRAEASEPLHPSTVGLRVCCLPLGTPVQELKASRHQWRPPVSRSACEEVLGHQLSEAHHADLLLGLRKFRILTLPRIRYFLSFTAVDLMMFRPVAFELIDDISLGSEFEDSDQFGNT